MASFPLLGRRVQISGSADPKTQFDTIRYGHTLVSRLVPRLLKAGMGLVLAVGKEPLANSSEEGAPALVFDWTALSAATEYLAVDGCPWPKDLGPPILIVNSEKGESEVPTARRPLWDRVLKEGIVRLERIQPGARSGTMIRGRQADFGDLLIIMGGGTGVEHLARLYMARRRPVIPLDLPVGASRSDGTGGSERLSREAISEPERFVRIRRELAQTASAFLNRVATRGGTVEPEVVVQGLVDLLDALAPPTAFYTRLVNPDCVEFPRVESFFRGVVDPVLETKGFRRVEIGTDRARDGFINMEIFDGLHFADVVVADVTALRPNCFIELGYALGRQHRVVVTAEKDTKLPFDQQAIPCHFWVHGMDDAERRKALNDFWERYVDRAPLVR